MLRKLLLSALALSLMAAANVETAYRVTVDGETLPGVYSQAQVERAVSTAERAAEEIARRDAELPEYEARGGLRLRPADGDAAALTNALISGTEGVEAVWEVSVGGTPAGLCNDASALGEVMEVMLAGGAAREAVAVSFTDDITLRRVYAPEGGEYDLMELSAAMRGMTQVMSVTAGGAVRYG